MTDDEILEVIRAHKEGKKIESKPIGGALDWLSCYAQPGWNFAEFDYRVAPEPRKPREWWISASPDYHPFDCAYKSPSAAVGDIVHVREVID